MIRIFLDFYKKLKGKEKILVISFIAVVALSLYFKIIYKPLSNNTRDYKLKTQRIISRLDELKVKLPDVGSGRAKIESLNNELKQTKTKINEMESKLVAKENISELLGEFSRQAEGVKLISLRQKVEKSKEHSKLFIEVEFTAPYNQTINYIRRLETISPFLKIEEMEFKTPSSVSAEVSGKMLFSSLLSRDSTGATFRAKRLKQPIPELRNIFISAKKEIIKKRTEHLKLEGITFNPSNPKAIINGEIVGINSRIDNFTVKKILPDSVILTDGEGEYNLAIH